VGSIFDDLSRPEDLNEEKVKTASVESVPRRVATGLLISGKRGPDSAGQRNDVLESLCASVNRKVLSFTPGLRRCNQGLSR
jgi:hypothetical protein